MARQHADQDEVCEYYDFVYNKAKPNQFAERLCDESVIFQLLDDLRVADEITADFERRYRLSSADFFTLYTQGLLDDGEHTDDFAEWSAYWQVKLNREAAFAALSGERFC